MLTQALALVLQLPPLAFGPALPRGAFEIPKILTCPVHDLGRIQAPAPPEWPIEAATLDPRGLRPAPNRHLLNPVADSILLMGLLATTRGGWDDRTWSTRRWESTGAVTPVLIPPQAPPIWSLGR